MKIESKRKWGAEYGNLHIIVCDIHRIGKRRELKILRRAPNYFACYFCVHNAIGGDSARMRT